MDNKRIKEDIKVATASTDKSAENEYRMITAFERFLEDEGEYDSPQVVREYPEPYDLYEKRLYSEVASGDCFLICDDATGDARELAEEEMRREIEDLGVDYMSDWSSYIDDDKMYDMMKEDVENMVYDEGDSWVIEEMESRDIISDEDKVADPDDPDEEPQYPESLINERKDDLVNAIADEWANSPASYFTEFRGDSLRELVNANMDLIDIDSLVEDALDYDGAAHTLDSYDGRGLSFEFTDADGKVHSMTAYQR